MKNEKKLFKLQADIRWTESGEFWKFEGSSFSRNDAFSSPVLLVLKRNRRNETGRPRDNNNKKVIYSFQ